MLILALVNMVGEASRVSPSKDLLDLYGQSDMEPFVKTFLIHPHYLAVLSFVTAKNSCKRRYKVDTANYSKERKITKQMQEMHMTFCPLLVN